MAQLRPSVVYEPRSDTTPEAELNALANVYRFILDCHAKKMAAEPPPSPTASTEPSSKEIPPMHRLYLANPNPRDSWDLLPMIRDLYSRRPETQDLEPWELQTLLWFLNYTGDLLPEDEIAAAVEVARTPFDPDEGVA